MDDRSPTVGDLVAHFQLRRRASTDAFTTGVRLARSGLVRVASVAPGLVHAEVGDRSLLHVKLSIEHGSLIGRCPRPAARHSVCSHQVAVAHAVWLSRRRYHRSTDAGDAEGRS